LECADAEAEERADEGRDDEGLDGVDEGGGSRGDAGCDGQVDGDDVAELGEEADGEVRADIAPGRHVQVSADG
jgi:hypothetical protein